MSKTNGYLMIGIAAGLFTATLVGLSVVAYVKSRRRRTKRIAVSDGTEINQPRYAKEYHIEDINA
jgi:hypothetical protein